MRLWKGSIGQFLLVRDEEGVRLADLESGQSKQIIKSVSHLAPYPQHQLEVVDRSEEESGLVQMLLIEYDGRLSTLKRFEMNENFLSTAFEIDYTL